MRQQEAWQLARHIAREEPLFVVQQIGRHEGSEAWALKVYDTITGRRVVITDAGRWPQLREAARLQQRQLLHQAFDGAARPSARARDAAPQRDESLDLDVAVGSH
jgi:hypothetical protein